MTWKTIDAKPESKQCSSCGNLNPPDSAQCIYCNAQLSDALAGQLESESERSFLQALFARSNPFTMIFIGVNVGVFVLMSLAGGFAVTSVDPQVLVGFGAKQNNLIAEQHEYWRVITSIFIHIGIIHLFLNNYALWIIGREIERIYGSARFVVLYLATGVVGSVGSYVFNPQATSAGASGAIFGLFGVMAAFAFRYRKEIPAILGRDIKRRIIPVIAINLIFGFSIRIVDNAAHIGGLLSGVALALIVPYMRPHERSTPLMWRTLQVICLAVISISFVDAFRSYKGPVLSVSNLTSQPGKSVETYFNNMRDANKALMDAARLVVGIHNSRDINADARRAMDAVDRAMSYVNSVPRTSPEADEQRTRLSDLINEQRSILSEIAQSDLKNLQPIDAKEKAWVERYNQFLTGYNKWLPGFLKEHGYELQSGDQS